MRFDDEINHLPQECECQIKSKRMDQNANANQIIKSKRMEECECECETYDIYHKKRKHSKIRKLNILNLYSKSMLTMLFGMYFKIRNVKRPNFAQDVSSKLLETMDAELQDHAGSCLWYMRSCSSASSEPDLVLRLTMTDRRMLPTNTTRMPTREIHSGTLTHGWIHNFTPMKNKIIATPYLRNLNISMKWDITK